MAEPKDEGIGLESLTNELSQTLQSLTAERQAYANDFREMKSAFEGKKSDAELEEKFSKAIAQLSVQKSQLDTVEAQLQHVQRRLQNPLFTGTKKDAKDYDTQAAIKLQERIFRMREGGNGAVFKADMNSLVNGEDYRAVVQKLSQVGLRNREEIIAHFSDAEKVAFKSISSGGADIAFLSPELLGVTLDCAPECGTLLDLYGQVSVRSDIFKYLQINDVSELGSYACPADCSAPLASAGLSVHQGSLADFRGVYCFTQDLLRNAPINLVSLMFSLADRSHRIKRNRALIAGDGTSSEGGSIIGWAGNGGGFPVRKTSVAGKFRPEDFRNFINSINRDFGKVTPIMHQNVFAMLASMKDANGRFIFGDGIFNFSPEVESSIRVSNCLPDPTEELTKGADNLTSGDFIMAAAAWKEAYYSVEGRPMFMQQYMGGTTAWCVQYQFGAKDGGFIGCPNAGRILKVQ